MRTCEVVPGPPTLRKHCGQCLAALLGVSDVVKMFREAEPGPRRSRHFASASDRKWVFRGPTHSTTRPILGAELWLFVYKEFLCVVQPVCSEPSLDDGLIQVTTVASYR